MPVTICIVQFDRSSRDPELNMKKMLNMLKSMSRPADIILLPEGWLGPQVLEDNCYSDMLRALQSELPGGTVLVSGAQYTRYGERIISAGAFIWKNNMVWFDKIFPSRAIGERGFVKPGNRLPVIVHEKLAMASIVCVDLFYPELVRRLAAAGAIIIFNPANIPESRIKLWQSIGITRAAENTVFIAMANNTETFYPDGRNVSGGSYVTGPDGKLFVDFGPQPGLYYAEIEPDLVTRTRERWMYLADIREFERAPLSISTEHYNI